MSFDNFYHVDLGNILTLLGMLSALYVFHTTNVRRIARMEFKVALMWRRFARRFNMDEDLEHTDDNDYLSGS